MDQATLVADFIGSGVDLIDALRGSSFALKDAFWAYDADDDQWYLYLVSPYVDRFGARESYLLVQEMIRKLDRWKARNPLEVKVLGESEPMAKAVASDIDRFEDQRNTPLRLVSGLYKDGIRVEKAWIYPRRSL